MSVRPPLADGAGDSAHGYIAKVYGRRQDKPLKPRQARLMEALLPRLEIGEHSPQSLDLDALFPGYEQFALEIGFGGGEHIAHQAEMAPKTGFIGAEPFVNGVAKLLVKIEERRLENIRIRFGDARPLMEALPDGRLSRLFVLHPDPWPKRRHFKRRIISTWFIGEAARLIAPGGELRVASDVPDYIKWTLMLMRGRSEFAWTAECAAHWRERPLDAPATRYGLKGVREGRPPVYLQFVRTSL